MIFSNCYVCAYIRAKNISSIFLYCMNMRVNDLILISEVTHSGQTNRSFSLTLADGVGDFVRKLQTKPSDASGFDRQRAEN